MANSTTNVDTVISSQASKEVTINAALDAASQAMTYGRRASTSSGLTWGYYGGNVVKTDGTMAQIANGTLTLTASNTNYIVAAKATGAVSVSTANTNWLNQTDYWRLYEVVAGAATVTSYTDSRDFMQRPATGGGGSETTTTLGALINGATAKTTPLHADMVGLMMRDHDGEGATTTPSHGLHPVDHRFLLGLILWRGFHDQDFASAESIGIRMGRGRQSPGPSRKTLDAKAEIPWTCHLAILAFQR